MENNNNVENNELKIDVLEILDSAYNNKWLILLASLIMALLGFIYCHTVKVPVFTATTQVYILNSVTESISYNDMQTAIQLTSDYEQLITNVSVTEKVINKLGLNMSPQTLASRISVSSPEDTRILVISVRDTDPFMAKKIADAVREEASEQIVEIMRIDAVKLVNEARVPTSATGNAARRTAVALFFITALLSIAIVAVINLFDDRIKKPDAIERYFGISSLGCIPVERKRPVRAVKNNDDGGKE